MQRQSITEAVRKAIEESALTRYEIAKRSGVSQSSLSRFARGETTLSLESIEKLAPVLGVRIRRG